MSVPTIGAYYSAFRLLTNGFDYESSLRAALAFFDYVTVAVNTRDDDGTLVALQSLADQIDITPRLKVVSVDLSYDDVTFDGRLKDAALQACQGDVLVQMDLDETPVLNQRASWRIYAEHLLASEGVDCLMIPTIDLWNGPDTVRADVPFGVKMRMHKRGLHRGVWKEAWIRKGELFDTTRSDSGELTDIGGNLARAAGIVPLQLLHPSCSHLLNGFPYTIHHGYEDLEQRVRVNKAIWASHWTLRNAGRDAKVALDTDTLRAYPVIRHQLNLI